MNPGTSGVESGGGNGAGASESQGFNGHQTDYSEGLADDAAGNAAQEAAQQEIVNNGSGEGGADGNYTYAEEESIVKGFIFY